jgi:membrane protease YdiL (CAAX protease family)
VSTPNESAPLVESPTGAPTTPGQSTVGPIAPAVIDPDNPPWGLAAGILTWVGSVALLILIGLLFILPSIPNSIKGNPEKIKQFLTTDKTAVLLQILSAIPTHLLTFGIVWAVVTRFGKRPFWASLGWSWSEKFGVWKTIGLAVALFLVGVAIGNLIKGKPTDIDQIANNSIASRYTLAFAAAVTAPFVEELVYRGVLYSALRKTIGMLWAVAIVSILFAGVHVLEYYNNVGVILVISLLSLCLTILRAYTGKLLPCYIIHLIFNGITAIIIIIEPYLRQSVPEQKTPALMMLWRTVRPLI